LLELEDEKLTTDKLLACRIVWSMFLVGTGSQKLRFWKHENPTFVDIKKELTTEPASFPLLPTRRNTTPMK